MQLRRHEMKIKKDAVYIDDERNFMELESFLHQDITDNYKEHQLKMLETAVAELKDKQRQCIELFYIKQKSYDEICELTGYSNNDVKSSIQNGKRNLKIILGNKGVLLWLAMILWTSNPA